MADSDEDTNWTIDLETALIEGCDYGTLRNICKGRPVPEHLRAEIWQICLNVVSKSDQLSQFDGLYDMLEQNILREDCQSLVDKLGNEEEEKLSVASDLESLVTFYCKARGMKYERGNGWLDILQPMLALKYTKSELYNCFYAFTTKYIPRDCRKNGKPFHLFRLLILYHDPELCSFLDSMRITPDTYAYNWVKDLFASTCDLKVTLNMWDVYLQHGDPFLLFSLALVILVNAKDQIMSMKNGTKQDILDKLSAFPSALEADDIEDFCSLAQYYAAKTPQSFRRDYQSPLFGTSLASQKPEASELSVGEALCLPVSDTELLQPNTGDGVRYFVVDCRPADQYNNGHLPTAFHLDPNLMLQNPAEFDTAVDALISAQKQALAAGSVAGGDHLCFMGSGREAEDQYVNMVLANFLQRNSQYVSITRGGYAALHETLKENLSDGLTDHNVKGCIVCNPDAETDGNETTEEFQSPDTVQSLMGKFGKLSSLVKGKSAIVKEKMINYIKNEQTESGRHVSGEDRVGKRYRNMASVFTIGDDEDDESNESGSDEDHREVVNLDTWFKKPDVICAYQCQEVKETGYTYPSHILVTDLHMFVLREIPNQKRMAWLQSRRALGNIVKITFKKKCPEFVTFKYGSNDDERGLVITNIDRFIIPQADEAKKVIKQQIMIVLEALDS